MKSNLALFPNNINRQVHQCLRTRVSTFLRNVKCFRWKRAQIYIYVSQRLAAVVRFLESLLRVLTDCCPLCSVLFQFSVTSNTTSSVHNIVMPLFVVYMLFISLNSFLLSI